MLRSISLQSMWTDRPYPERVKAAADAGFDLVDFWDWRTVDLDAISQSARSNCIGINGFFGNRKHALCNPAAKQGVLDELKASIDCAHQLGAKQIAVFSNAFHPDGIVLPAPPLPPAVLEQASLDALHEIAPIAADAGVTLILEHLNTVFLPAYLWSSASSVISLCRQMNQGSVRLAFDAFHQQLTGGRLTEHLIAALPYMARFDVAEVPGRFEPGYGEIDFRFLRNVLLEHEWQGILTFEVTPHDGVHATAITAIEAYFPQN